MSLGPFLIANFLSKLVSVKDIQDTIQYEILHLQAITNIYGEFLFFLIFIILYTHIHTLLLFPTHYPHKLLELSSIYFRKEHPIPHMKH